MPDGALEHFVARGAAEIGRHAAGKVLTGGLRGPSIETGAYASAEVGDGRARRHILRWRGDHVLIRELLAGVFHVEEGGRDLEDVMEEDAPRARSVWELLLEVLVGHLGDEATGRLKDVVVARFELVRRERWRGIVWQVEEVNDILDDLGEDELIAARDDGHRACAKPLEFLQAGLVGEDVDRCELDPTDREVFFNPETARSMRLPEDLDWSSHVTSHFVSAKQGRGAS